MILVMLESIKNGECSLFSVLINCSNTSSFRGTAGQSVNCFVNFHSGFCYAISDMLHIFHKDKTYLKFVKKATFSITSRLYSPAMNEIIDISVNIDRDTVIARAKHNQIYIAPLNASDSDAAVLKPLGELLHTSDIIDMAMCPWKSIVMTAGIRLACGIDRFIIKSLNI